MGNPPSTVIKTARRSRGRTGWMKILHLGLLSWFQAQGGRHIARHLTCAVVLPRNVCLHLHDNITCFDFLKRGREEEEMVIYTPSKKPNNNKRTFYDKNLRTLHNLIFLLLLFVMHAFGFGQEKSLHSQEISGYDVGWPPAELPVFDVSLQTPEMNGWHVHGTASISRNDSILSCEKKNVSARVRIHRKHSWMDKIFVFCRKPNQLLTVRVIKKARRDMAALGAWREGSKRNVTDWSRACGSQYPEPYRGVHKRRTNGTRGQVRKLKCFCYTVRERTESN